MNIASLLNDIRKIYGMKDMVTIPLYIKKLVPEYRLYVRHYSNSEFETVLYAVP